MALDNLLTSVLAVLDAKSPVSGHKFQVKVKVG